jgi:EAL domain-containing protein (putative c-di-GMP-specific phosphodiesterase class I)
MASITGDDVAAALRKREFVLHYQPKSSLFTNRIVGAEALARWPRPDGSVLRPASFMGGAERCGLLGELSLQLLPQLVHDLVAGGLDTDLCVSFNVTAQDFHDDDLNNAIFDAIAGQHLAPSCLELEITETQALGAGVHVLERVDALGAAGVGLAMDDYGVGYSNIDTLSLWPFTTIKLDQGIVARMLGSRKNATIVRSSIRLGHELGLNVVAEGVETKQQHDFLVEAGCELMQG